GVPDLRPLGPSVPGLRLRSPGGQVVARRCVRPNHPIPRLVFDARLVDAAVARGAVLRRHRVRTMRVEPNRVVLDEAIAARVVIGAGGESSGIRRLLVRPAPPPRAVAVAIRGYSPATAEPDELLI